MILPPMRAVCVACLLAAAVLLPGCESKITSENYDRISVGMTRQAVENILGSGTDETASGTSISSAGIADSKSSNEKTFVWREGGATITVVFKDGKVVEKSKTGM